MFFRYFKSKTATVSPSCVNMYVCLLFSTPSSKYQNQTKKKDYSHKLYLHTKYSILQFQSQ